MLRLKPAILLTGSPRIGKSTIIMRILDCLGSAAGGFYTREIRDQDQRIGFEINTLESEICRLAEKTSATRFLHEIEFGAYKVNLDAVENIAIPALLRAAQKNRIVVIDEIGPMEIFSSLFCSTVMDILNNPNVLVIGTIVERPYAFADEVKNHRRVTIEQVTLNNRDLLPEKICKNIGEYLRED